METPCPLVWRDLTQFKLGSLGRYLYHILRAAGAINAPSDDETARPSDEVIRIGLQGCLDKIDTAVRQELDAMNSIQDALTN